MREILAQLTVHVERVLAWWKSLPPEQQRKLALSAAGAFVLLAAFTYGMTRTEYERLYTGLTEAEAGAVVERLEELDIPYRLERNGTTILAPSKRIDDIRLLLAKEGMPQSGRLGFELFDQSSFGTTEFSEQVNFRRAIEGELERTVGSMDEIRSARVHVSLPKRSVFLESEEAAKASVVVEFEPGHSLDTEAVRAVERLVASAVEGLEPSRVTVMDRQGRLFSRRNEFDDELTHQQLEFRRKLESETERRIRETLEPFLGPGRLRANVAMDVDWDAGEQTEEVIDPNPVAVSTQVTEEQNFDDIPVGTPGTAANLPRQPAEPTQRRAGLSRSMQTTNYETSRTVTRLSIERGAVKRMSVAVLVDHDLELDEAAGKLIRVPRPEATLETIRELVTAASGAVAERGDTVTVESLPFTILEPPLAPPEPPPDPSEEILSMEWAKRYRVYIIGGVVLLLLLAVAVAVFRRSRRLAKVRAERQEALEAERERRELEEAQEQEAEQRAAEEERLLKGLKLAPVQTSKTQVLKKHLEELTREEPETVAKLMKAWIHEDDQ